MSYKGKNGDFINFYIYMYILVHNYVLETDANS